ncbi:type I-F CRISPR-associated protein Csy2 [Pseudoalteromonas ruthenica]|uniref:CRISPR-associated protein Csy2 n=1 Tax=Pseudoalteromonas ruthenica TaxID=151081 RepID=A0A0F4Q0D2_9GAMM|nr:type I-F CRISPR-associated protein Csy2 [Pseudoalteromonas ruthenica]KJZ00766.1 CRISPR-associated protein Csy2 [Pseudoalteromonas ruthenica]KJZ01181.1 CRISPR-associated protein Csy2 [Pseudoalteromonas ruthenica]TMO85654.1 type I-F CRISPR-associated protein Csy2 [Pseudoalteromonas ruthenica]TMO92423.1 type I-F CRISPR-associated protein Csy2 [Pseudoalteromonas ruthenica]TMO98893.1 type I-F CRISPR-associated protein Csy2 [Pseudoalteromonas ruthenica]
MSQYILIKKLNVQNANTIAGLTYGFPAITNFLGFAHALSRKLPSSLNVNLGGVVVISHKNQVHARQPKGWGDYVFALTRNPLTYQGKTAPINEEGRMNMQISLLVEVKGLVAGDTLTETDLKAHLKRLIPTLRLAGGQILGFEACELLNTEEQQAYALRRLMPGFVLMDRHEYLAAHFEQRKTEQDDVCLFDAWCDFATLTYRANPSEDQQTEDTVEAEQAIVKANWEYVPKPNAGYLVPIATGFCAISPLYDAGEVANVRDNTVPVTFAETAYSVGEWQSVHRLHHIETALWRYTDNHPWYIATTHEFNQPIIEPDFIDSEAAFNPDNF